VGPDLEDAAFEDPDLGGAEPFVETAAIDGD
jgi:hypothetical protein